MKLFIPNPLPDHAETIIRRAGYAEHRDSYSTVVSYTHRLGPEFYPRYHVYIMPANGGVNFDLHIDQKRASYGGGTHAHAGEYEGTTVEREIIRLRDFISKYRVESDEDEKPKGFFGKLFGGHSESE